MFEVGGWSGDWIGVTHSFNNYLEDDWDSVKWVMMMIRLDFGSDIVHLCPDTHRWQQIGVLKQIGIISGLRCQRIFLVSISCLPAKYL